MLDANPNFIFTPNISVSYRSSFALESIRDVIFNCCNPNLIPIRGKRKKKYGTVSKSIKITCLKKKITQII